MTKYCQCLLLKACWYVLIWTFSNRMASFCVLYLVVHGFRFVGVECHVIYFSPRLVSTLGCRWTQTLYMVGIYGVEGHKFSKKAEQVLRDLWNNKFTTRGSNICNSLYSVRKEIRRWVHQVHVLYKSIFLRNRWSSPSKALAKFTNNITQMSARDCSVEKRSLVQDLL